MIKWLFFLLVGFFFSLDANPLQMNVRAKSAILINADTGAVLYEKNAQAPAFPASITKIATALYVLDVKKIDVSKHVTVSANSLKMKPVRRSKLAVPAYLLETDGTMMGLIDGEEISIDSLLHGLMLVSANDAANVLAEASCGSIPTFLDELNGYLLSIGCQNTHFCSPHGLHHPDHVTSAYDMALITKKALQNPKFCSIVSRNSYTKPPTNKNPAIELQQHNKLVRPGHFFYSKAIGVKTGYTSQAKNTLVAAAKQDGRTLIAVILGCSERAERYADAQNLFEMAFQEKKIRRTILTGGKTFSHNFAGAKTPVRASLQKELFIEYFPAEEPAIQAAIHWATPSIPIHRGNVIGKMQISDLKGRIIQSRPLYALEDVSFDILSITKDWWKRWFGKGSASLPEKEPRDEAWQTVPLES